MLGLMQCVAEAVVAKGVKGLLELVPGGPYLHELGADALKRHREKKAAKKLEDDVKEMIEAKADAVLAAAKRAVGEAAPDLAPRDKELVLQYVSAMPEAARLSLVRKEDPTGTTLPFGFTIHEPDDVAKVLPQHPPRFVPGDWVPGREDNWRLERRLGGGGFGEVWLARHQFKRSEKPRAVKFCTDAGARKKLVAHEKQLIVQVMERAGDHPNIVPLLECHLSGDAPWLMYEYVEGGTLADTITSWRSLAPAERLKCAMPVLQTIARAVGHCHAMTPAIIHRDLKPANVLMERGVPRVTDFGIGGAAADLQIVAETRGVPSLLGRLPTMLSGSYSLLYASPQQRNGDKPDPRDDVHAIGVIAYQMLVGDLTTAPGRDMDDDLRDAGAPEGLTALIGKSVAQKAERRPKDARELAEALAEWLPIAPAADPVPASKTVWRITVPGALRLLRPGFEAIEIADTPADVAIDPREAYELALAQSVTDTDMLGLESLGGLVNLTALGLYFTQQVTDAGLAHLRPLTNLTQVRLWSDGMTDAGLAHLRPLTNLTYLFWWGDGMTDAGLAHLRPLANLRALHLTARVTDAGMAHLRPLTSLTELSLSARVSDAGLAHLRSLSSLTSLDLTSGGVTGTGLAHLQPLTKLTKLHLRSHGLTDAGLAHLRPLTNLTELCLLGKGLTDSGLAYLSSLTNLKELTLYDTRVTDAGLTHLRPLTNLKELHLGNTWRPGFLGRLLGRGGWTEEGIADLKKALPNCNVTHITPK